MSEHIVSVRIYVDDLPGLAGGNGADCLGGVSGFSRAAERDHRDDYRRDESHACRALLHARALQLDADLGDFCVGAVLAGDYVSR